MEFAKDPSSIGIEDCSYYLDHKTTITDEEQALQENFEVLGKVIQFLTDSREAYSIISKSIERNPSKPSEMMRILNYISKARFL